jgi:DNA transformation protein
MVLKVRIMRRLIYSSSMAVNDDYLQYVLEQLAGLGRVFARPMFGGVGLYHGERIFGVIFRDTLYFKVNGSNRADYEARGMDRFRPYPGKPKLSMTYYEVPADTLEDADECVVWAQKSAAVAAAKRPAVAVSEARRPPRQKNLRRK